MSEIHDFENYLPKYLSDDIFAFQEGLRNNSTLIDCLYCEVQSSINSAFYAREISEKEADILRERYLGL